MIRLLLLVVSLSLSLMACADDAPPVPAEAPPAESVVEVAVVEPVLEPVPSEPVVRPLADGATLEVFRDLGLSRPVAVIHDPRSDVYLIANAGEGDAPGFISSVLPDGQMDALRWIDGAADGVALNTPAGMALVDNRLFVTDGAFLRVFDRESGRSRGEVHVLGAISLGDVAVGSRGEVYVTDWGVSAARSAAHGTVYRISRRGAVRAIAKSSVLGRPSGVVTIGKQPWVASVEPDMFYGVSRRGKLTHGAALPATGRLSGLTYADGRIFFSSPQTRTVYAGPPAGPFEPLVMWAKSPGDVGWDAGRQRVLVPLMDDDALELHIMAVEPS